MRALSTSQARRIALTAQGLADPKPKGKANARHFRRTFDRVGLLQIDSVNVLERSHYLPVFARVGAYDRAALDRYAFEGPELFEFWGHAASLIPIERFPLFRHRMNHPKQWHRQQALAEREPEYIEQALEQVRTRGPISISALEDSGDRIGSWWGGGKGKVALEWLFRRGLLTTKKRGPGFERVYELTERVIPQEHLSAEPPPSEEAKRQLLLHAARSHGLGTAVDLADYYRLNTPQCRPLLAQLVDEGALERVQVEGWTGPVYLDPEAVLPRRVNARALLSPFDSLIWHRERTERLFDFHYRVEIYVPPPKRVYGYYVLPFLLGDSLVARVDLKSDRQARHLLVQASHIEAGQDPDRVATELAAELHGMADWLGLDDVVVKRKGKLARTLKTAVG